MPKAITVPPLLNMANIPALGAKVTIKSVRVLIDQKTQIGTTKKGIALEVDYQGTVFSQMFSLDNAIIAGSAGRLLNSIGITDTEMPDFDKAVQKFVGKQFNVVNRGGKIYWYP